MGDKSGIEWTDATWTPIRARNKATGKIGWHCVHESEACRFCYAESLNVRLGTGLPFKPGHEKDIEIFLDEKMLLAPLRWQKPRMIFVCSMTDLFANFVKDSWIDQIFAVMAMCQQHTFQVLTKRSARMKNHLTDSQTPDRIAAATKGIAPQRHQLPAPPVIIDLPIGERADSGYPTGGFKRAFAAGQWPLHNVWAGVSAEDQEQWDARVPHLEKTPAAIRFVSYEPALGPLSSVRRVKHSDDAVEVWDYLKGTWQIFDGDHYRSGKVNKIDWLICGGESGREARPMSIQWAREVRDQCAEAGTPFFFKQFGEWRPAGAHPSETPGRFAFGDYEHDRTTMIQVDCYPRQFTKFGARSVMERVGKKAAGRLLDGVEHSGMPRQ